MTAYVCLCLCVSRGDNNLFPSSSLVLPRLAAFVVASSPGTHSFIPLLAEQTRARRASPAPSSSSSSP